MFTACGTRSLSWAWPVSAVTVTCELRGATSRMISRSAVLPEITCTATRWVPKPACVILEHAALHVDNVSDLFSFRPTRCAACLVGADYCLVDSIPRTFCEPVRLGTL